MTKGAQPTLCTRVEKRSTLRMPVPPRQPSSTKQASAGAWYRGDPHRGILRDLHSYNVVHHTVHRFARCAAPPLTGKLALILSVFLSTSRSTIRSANLQSAVSIEEVYVHRYATRRGDDGARGYPKVTLRLPHSSVLLTVALTLQPGAHKARIRVLGRRLFTAIDTAVRPRK